MKQILKYYFLMLGICFLSACKNSIEEVSYRNHNCGVTPVFTKNLGFDLNRAAFSTSDDKKMGLHFVQLVAGTKNVEKMYQDSSWKKAGWMSAILTDKFANVFCIPAPMINTLHNPLKDQNNLYRVNPQTGKMELFMQLPGIDEKNIENPYGLMGLAFNCEADVLYVSSVAGSTRNKQKGKIFCIDVKEKKVMDTYESGDAFGIAVCYKDGYRKLYFGSARNSNIYSIGLQENGKFSKNEKLEFSLQGLGVRGDDKPKKIREDAQGNLIVSGYEFNFNLTAPSEKQETNYTFTYNAGDEKWIYK